ncbi:MAG: hypothetical protein RR576_10750, partial [Oscillospiraceae bacterium]
DANGNAQKPAFGREDGKFCLFHWILLALSAITAILMLFKRKKNKKEMEKLLMQEIEVDETL